MKKRDKLYRLINTLTKGEKRHFTLYASTFQDKVSKNDYFILFQLIDKHTIQSEDELKKIIKPKQFKNLPALKVYLYKKILESLFLNSDSQADGLYKGMLNARQLFHKKLYEDSANLLEGLRHKRNPTHLTVLDNLKHQQVMIYLNADGQHKHEQKSIDLLFQIEKHLEVELFENKYKILERQVIDFIGQIKVRDQQNIENINQVLNNNLLQDTSCLKSLHCHHCYFNIKTMIFFSMKDYPMLWENTVRHFEYIDKHQSDFPIRAYLLAWYNLLLAAILSKQADLFLKYIDLFKRKEFMKIDLGLYLFYFYISSLIFCIHFKNSLFFSKKHLERNIKTDITKNLFSSYYQKIIELHLSHYYFRVKDFEKCKDLVEDMVIKYKLETKSIFDLQLALLFFLIQIESKNYLYCLNKINAFQKKIKIEKSSFVSYNQILNQLKRFVKQIELPKPNNIRIQSIFSKMMTLVQNEQGKELSDFYKDFFILEWIEEKKDVFK